MSGQAVHRLARAQQALRQAERVTGVRGVLRPASGEGVREQQNGQHEPAERRRALDNAVAEGLPLPDALVPLLGASTVRAGSIVELTGSMAALLAFAAAMARQRWCGVVGAPEMGLLAAAEMGVDLRRMVLVPDPGVHVVQAVAVLTDAFDVVILGPRMRIREADRRVLSARLRRRGGVLLSITPWPGSDITLSATPSEVTGLRRGGRPYAGREYLVSARHHGVLRAGSVWIDVAGFGEIEARATHGADDSSGARTATIRRPERVREVLGA